jgi:hypothetical protein
MQMIGIAVTLMGVFFVIRARYVESLALQPIADDVAKSISVSESELEGNSSLLHGEEDGEKEDEKVEEARERKTNGGYVAVTADDKEMELQEIAGLK